MPPKQRRNRTTAIQDYAQGSQAAMNHALRLLDAYRDLLQRTSLPIMEAHLQRFPPGSVVSDPASLYIAIPRELQKVVNDAAQNHNQNPNQNDDDNNEEQDQERDNDDPLLLPQVPVRYPLSVFTIVNDPSNKTTGSRAMCLLEGYCTRSDRHGPKFDICPSSVFDLKSLANPESPEFANLPLEEKNLLFPPGGGNAVPWWSNVLRTDEKTKKPPVWKDVEAPYNDCPADVKFILKRLGAEESINVLQASFPLVLVRLWCRCTEWGVVLTPEEVDAVNATANAGVPKNNNDEEENENDDDDEDVPPVENNNNNENDDVPEIFPLASHLPRNEAARDEFLHQLNNNKLARFYIWMCKYCHLRHPLYDRVSKHGEPIGVTTCSCMMFQNLNVSVKPQNLHKYVREENPLISPHFRVMTREYDPAKMDSAYNPENFVGIPTTASLQYCTIDFVLNTIKIIRAWKCTKCNYCFDPGLHAHNPLSVEMIDQLFCRKTDCRQFCPGLLLEDNIRIFLVLIDFCFKWMQVEGTSNKSKDKGIFTDPKNIVSAIVKRRGSATVTVVGERASLDKMFEELNQENRMSETGLYCCYGLSLRAGREKNIVWKMVNQPDDALLMKELEEDMKRDRENAAAAGAENVDPNKTPKLEGTGKKKY